MEPVAELNDIALEYGAFKTAEMEVSDIAFRREFRDACVQNLCGKYGTNWMCPPGVGDIDGLIARAREYKHAFILQSVGALEDSFDWEGIQEAAHRHRRMLKTLFSRIPPSMGDTLNLGAGECDACGATCAKRDDEPCRSPDLAIASMEAYGIAVSDLAERCGLQYVNGPNTVTFFGAILYN
jgi:predicted metal-binding protein